MASTRGCRSHEGRGLSRRFRIGPNAARVVVVTALLLVFIVALLLISASRGTYEIRAVFDDVRGLIPGGDVTAGAIVVGSVTTVELNEDGDPEVTMAIDDDFRLHEGAIADIRLASNVGAVNRAVDLKQGDPTAPELPEGTVLGGEQTDNPVDFDLAVSTLQPEVRDDLRDVLAGLDEALKGRGEDFDRTLRHSGVALSETGRLLAAGQPRRRGAAHDRERGRAGRRGPRLEPGRPRRGRRAHRDASSTSPPGARPSSPSRCSTSGPRSASGRALLDRTASATPNLRELIGGPGPARGRAGAVREADPARDRRRPAPSSTRPRSWSARRPAALRKTRALVSAQVARGAAAVRPAAPAHDPGRRGAPRVHARRRSASSRTARTPPRPTTPTGT